MFFSSSPDLFSCASSSIKWLFKNWCRSWHAVEAQLTFIWIEASSLCVPFTGSRRTEGPPWEPWSWMPHSHWTAGLLVWILSQLPPAPSGHHFSNLTPKASVICDSCHLSTALWPFLSITFWIVEVIIWFTFFHSVSCHHHACGGHMQLASLKDD